MTDIGFTGTRHGMTTEQQDTLRRLLAPRPRPFRLHHGMCVGADAQAHVICRDMDIELEGHPPTNTVLMATGLEGFAKMNKPLPYLQRNKAIVDATSDLLAAPQTGPNGGGGTWSTIVYARRIGRPVTIIMPSGKVRLYEGDTK